MRHPAQECAHEDRKQIAVMFDNAPIYGGDVHVVQCQGGITFWQCRTCKDVWTEKVEGR